MTRKSNGNQMTCYRKAKDDLPLVDVYLDGEVLSHCIKANSKRGFAVVYVYPFVIKNDCLVTKKLRGRVKFKRVSND